MPPRQNPNVKDVTGRLRTNRNVNIVDVPRRVLPISTPKRAPHGPTGSFRVVITTYNRPEDLTFLLRDIWGSSANTKISVSIFDDASTADMSMPQALASMLGFSWHRNSTNAGKRGFAAWLCSLIGTAARSMVNDELLVVLQDDHRLSENFFAHISAISAKTRFDALMPARDSRMNAPHWTGYAPRKAGELIQTQWLDGVFICPKDTAKVIGESTPSFDSSRWSDPSISSGFGSHISTVLNQREKSLFVAAKSIAVHTGMDSRMHPVERKLHPLASIDYIEGEKVYTRLMARQRIVCGLAAIPTRVDVLRQVVATLAPQVDELTVYLNGFSRTPEIAAPATALSLVRSQQAKGDLGDAGKFYATLGRRDCIVMSCDDDIIYPRGYALRMVRAAMRTAPSVVTAYGSTLPSKFSSYFADRTVHPYRNGTKWMKVHVPGTGVTAFCGDALDLELTRDFSTKFMSDIHMAVAAKRSKVPVFLVEQSPRWIRDAKVPRENTLYSRYAAKDSPQTRELIKVGPW